MHEYSVLQAMLDRVDQELRAHQAKRAHVVRLTVGELSGVEVPLLERAWTLFADHPRWGGTELVVDRVAALWRCPRCQQGIERGAILRCPGCGLPAELAAGGEILLQRIEMEV